MTQGQTLCHFFINPLRIILVNEENPDYDITVMLCGYGLGEFVSASKAVHLLLPEVEMK